MTVISPRARIVLYALLAGIFVIILLSVVGINIPYNVKYVILAPVLVLLFVIISVLEKHRHKKW